MASATANVNDDYESDPDESRLSLSMRRRVASDDEDGEDNDEIRASDDDDDLDDREGIPEDYDDEEDVEIKNEVGNVLLDREVVESQVVEGDHEKKEKEPFAVPTAGAFYMHDDRFRDNAAGRQRRTVGAQKIWESRDERRWGHDKFDEVTSQYRNQSVPGRNSKEHHRGRGRNRGAARGYARGNRSKMPEDNDSQAPVPKTIRGRGPRRYDLVYKRKSEAPQTQNKQPGKNLEKSACSYSEKGLASSSSVAHGALPAKQNMVASNLSSASPPFYPSGGSSKDLNVALKMDTQSVQPSSMFRGKPVIDSSGLNNLHLEDSIGKPSGSSNVHSSGSTSTSKGAQVRVAGHKPSPSASHIGHACKVSGVQVQLIPPQQGPAIHNQTHPYAQGYPQPVSKHSGNGSQISSSSPSGYSLEDAEEAQSESGKVKTAIVPNASSAVQGGALGPFMYNGGQIMGATGNMGVAHGDPNFPAFLPVMQFGAQHPGGIEVPAVGMAFPGYVHGQGSSEMTWLPVLAGAAGALGATYCPPYLLNGASYNPQHNGSPFFASSSKNEAETNKALNGWNPSQKLEHAGENFDQRQNKPRRYSEMKFGQ